MRSEFGFGLGKLLRQFNYGMFALLPSYHDLPSSPGAVSYLYAWVTDIKQYLKSKYPETFMQIASLQKHFFLKHTKRRKNKKKYFSICDFSSPFFGSFPVVFMNDFRICDECFSPKFYYGWNCLKDVSFGCEWNFFDWKFIQKIFWETFSGGYFKMR